MKSTYIPLSTRSILTITGADCKKFLQSILTNDVYKVSREVSIYACILTPQGKYLFDFFVAEVNGKIFIDCSTKYKEQLMKKLMLYKLRSDVEINDLSDKYESVALLGEQIFQQEGLTKESEAGQTIKFCKGIAYLDPRTAKLYARSIIEKENNYQSFIAQSFVQGNIEDYDNLRISLTIPEVDKELIPEKSFPLQNRLDEINAIDFEKGCYVGQEVTARSKHRGKTKKTLLTINLNDEHKGEITSSLGDNAIIFTEKLN